MSTTAAPPRRWYDLQPWHTNLALVLVGCGMVGFSLQLISEHVEGFQIGFSGVSSSHLVLWLAAIAIFLVRPANVDRYTFPIILAFAILCRLVMLFPEAFLSTDVYRYAWDGVVQHAHINPFRYAPGDPALAFLRDPNQDLFDNINRRDYAHTIYPPVAQLFFYLITTISPTVTFMKMAMVLFEGVTMAGLVHLLRAFGMQREWTLLYAWCPLVIWEFGSSGHLDSLVMALFTLALVARLRDRPVLTGLLLGAAVLTKFYPLVLFPALWRRWDWKMPATMAALAAVTYTVYLSAGWQVLGFLGGYVKEEGISSGERYFLLDFLEHQPGLHWLSQRMFLGFAVVLFAALTAWAYRVATPRDAAPAAFLPPAFALAAALMLLFSPHYPWYIAWLIPFFVLMPSLTAATYIGGLFYLCTTAMAVGSGPQQYKLNEILYASILVALMLEVLLRQSPAGAAWLERRNLTFRRFFDKRLPLRS